LAKIEEVDMPEVLDRVKRWIGQITEVGLLLVALGIVTQILFGREVTSFLGGDIVGNLTGLIAALGDNGLVGLIALAIILWLFWRRQPG
jgi:hypothetical protein